MSQTTPDDTACEWALIDPSDGLFIDCELTRAEAEQLAREYPEAHIAPMHPALLA